MKKTSFKHEMHISFSDQQESIDWNLVLAVRASWQIKEEIIPWQKQEKR